jgi:hypothetical protein
MNTQSVQKTLDVMAGLEQLEKAIAGLYELAAKKWPVDAELWRNMAGEEIKHAEYIKSLTDILIKKPAAFEVGRVVNVDAVKSALDWINKNVAEIEEGTFSDKKMLFLARDLEQSILESKYSDILKTENLEYNKIAKQIVRETFAHKKIIDEAISKLPKG